MIKLFRKHPLVVLPSDHLSWIGITASELKDALTAIGFRSETVRMHASDCDSSLGSTAFSDAVTYSVCIETERLPSEWTPDCDALQAQHSAAMNCRAEQVHALYGRLRPVCVVVVQGYEATNAVSRFCAIKQGIPVLALENTAIRSRVVWDNISGITTNRNLARNMFWRYRDSVSKTEVSRYCDGLISETKTLKSHEHQAPNRDYNARSDRPMVLFLGQVYTDSSIVFGLAGWRSPLHVLHRLCNWCQSNDHDLVVKLHPKELSGKAPHSGDEYRKLTWRKMQTDPELLPFLREESIVIDHDNVLDTYSLIDACEFAVTINSQAGLEAAIRGKPVVVCGDAFYANLGFTIDCPDPDSFGHTPFTTDREQLSIAQRFTFIFFEKYCRPKTPVAIARLISETSHQSLR